MRLDIFPVLFAVIILSFPICAAAGEAEYTGAGGGGAPVATQPGPDIEALKAQAAAGKVRAMRLRDFLIVFQVVLGGHVFLVLPLFLNQFFHVGGILAHRLRHVVPLLLLIGRDFEIGMEVRYALVHRLALHALHIHPGGVAMRKCRRNRHRDDKCQQSRQQNF